MYAENQEVIVMNSRSEKKERATRFYRLLDYVKTRKGELCLLLGNGASIGSGGKPWDKIADEIASTWKLDFPTDYSINEKFNLIFRNCGDYHKRAILDKHISDLPVSNGYMALSNLIKEGYFDVIFTTNFDHSINKSLTEIDWVQDIHFTVQILNKISPGDDGKEIESSGDSILSILNDKRLKAKIVKLHGDSTYPDTLILSDDDIKAHTPFVKKVLGGYLKHNTQKGVLLVGYSGNDTDIADALNEAKGNEAVWWLNPSEPSISDPIASFLTKRSVFSHSTNAILGDDGKFDNVFGKLHNELIKSKITPLSELDTIIKKIQNVGEGKGQKKDLDVLLTFLENNSIVIPSTIKLIKNLSGDDQLQLLDNISRLQYIDNSYRLAIGQYYIGMFLCLLLDNDIINNKEKLHRLIERGGTFFSGGYIEQDAGKIIQKIFEADCIGYDLQVFESYVQDQLSLLESEKIQNNSYNSTLEKFDIIISCFDRLIEYQRFANKTRLILNLRSFEKTFLEMADDLTRIIYPLSEILDYPPHMEEFVDKCNVTTHVLEASRNQPPL